MATPLRHRSTECPTEASHAGLLIATALAVFIALTNRSAPAVEWQAGGRGPRLDVQQHGRTHSPAQLWTIVNDPPAGRAGDAASLSQLGLRSLRRQGRLGPQELDLTTDLDEVYKLYA